MAFEIYKQDNDYNVSDIYKGEIITLEIIKKYIDLSKLENNDLMCYGIGNENNFIEIDYNKKYSLRISIENDEYFEDLNGDIITELYNKVIEKIGSGS